MAHRTPSLDAGRMVADGGEARAHHRFEGMSDPVVGDFLEGVPIRKAAQDGASVTRTARWDYGFPVPVSGDPWQDDGGED